VSHSPKQGRVRPDPADTQPLPAATQATNGAPFTIRDRPPKERKNNAHLS